MLSRVPLTCPAGSFPITLRHRLHCTIVRCSTSCPAPNDTAACDSGSGSSGGLPSVSNSCVGHCVYGEEHVSLNEVVIERGISPFLTNLECFCDGTFVTHVQVRRLGGLQAGPQHSGDCVAGISSAASVACMSPMLPQSNTTAGWHTEQKQPSLNMQLAADAVRESLAVQRTVVRLDWMHQCVFRCCCSG